MNRNSPSTAAVVDAMSRTLGFYVSQLKFCPWRGTGEQVHMETIQYVDGLPGLGTGALESDLPLATSGSGWACKNVHSARTLSATERPLEATVPVGSIKFVTVRDPESARDARFDLPVSPQRPTPDSKSESKRPH